MFAASSFIAPTEKELENSRSDPDWGRGGQVAGRQHLRARHQFSFEIAAVEWASAPPTLVR